ncbi:MAG: VWA domain-containing protein [Deltaproteobacteria bacterium]|nr:VWA domain-containing protein [Deltaproteobacteria bacterium]
MSKLERYGLLGGCFLISAAVLALPMRTGPAPYTPPDPVPPPVSPHVPADPSRAEISLPLGSSAVLRAGLSQAVVARATEQVVDVAMEVEGTRAQSGQSRALVLCLDRSGSMAGRNMDQALESARWFIRSLSEDDELALVSFSTRPGVDLPLTRADAAGKAAALAVVDAMHARGGTHLHGGLSLAVAEAARSGAPIHRVVLVSDGVPTEGDVRAASILSLAGEAASQGVTVTTLGVGSQAPGGLMERVAVAAGGNFRFIRDGAGIREALQAELNASGRLAVRDVRVRLALPDGATLGATSGAIPEMQGRTVWARVGDVAAGDRRHVMFRVHLPAENVSGWSFAVHAVGRQSSTTVDTDGTLLASVSDDAAAVARSRIEWVMGQALLAAAATEVKAAAEAYSRGDSGGGVLRLREVANKMDEAARKQPALAPKARALRLFVDDADKETDPGMAANGATARAFDLAQ